MQVKNSKSGFHHFNIGCHNNDRVSKIITSNLFVPYIIHPTGITTKTKTLIDNIFSNSTNYKDGISGNLTISLSDHLAQFLIIPDECHHTSKNLNIFTRDTKFYSGTSANRMV